MSDQLSDLTPETLVDQFEEAMTLDSRVATEVVYRHRDAWEADLEEREALMRVIRVLEAVEWHKHGRIGEAYAALPAHLRGEQDE